MGSADSRATLNRHASRFNVLSVLANRAEMELFAWDTIGRYVNFLCRNFELVTALAYTLAKYSSIYTG